MTAPARKAAIDRLQRIVDKESNGKLSVGGMGPTCPDVNGEYLYAFSLGVHHPNRFEEMTSFAVDARTGKVNISEGAEEREVGISATDQQKIVNACYP